MTDRPYLLITGAAGALTQQVIRRLRRNYRLVVCDARREVTMPPDIPSFHIDFNKRLFEDLFRQYPFSGVVHLGRIGPNESTRMNRYNANVLGTQRLFDLSLKYGVSQVLVLSTYFVYGSSPFNPAMLTETAPLKAAEITMDLVDSVELENLSTIYLWKHPELNISILRPCNILGPGVNNSMSVLFSSHRVPVLAGFSPIMQFIHLEDMAEAIVLAFEQNKPGIYNVAPDDWVSYQRMVELCGCKKILIPSIPPALPIFIAKRMQWKGFPPYLLQFFKYSTTLNGHLFRDTFNFSPQYTLQEIANHYRLLKD